MKSTVKNVIIIVLLGLFVWTQFFINPDPDGLEPVIIVTPPIHGSVEETLEEVDTTSVAIADPVTKIVTKIVVDEEYKNKYEKAIKENDSLEAMNLFLKSIEINEYTKVLTDNDTIKITAYAKTRGTLLKYGVDYTIKSDTISYIPETINKRPKLTVLVGGEAIIPAGGPTGNPALKFDIGFQNQKGHIISGGVDTQRNIYIGYKHAISLRNLKLNPFKKNK